MRFETIDVYLIIDIFLLLLIGIGPKVALVPFLGVTRGLDQATKARIIRKMLITASATAVVLIATGGLLARLLHFSTQALGIAGGLILLILSMRMVLDPDQSRDEPPRGSTDPLRLASYPLAVPYLLNPVGIVVLVTVSAEARPVGLLAIVLGLTAVVIAIDALVFGIATRIESINETRMLVIEKVFGVLLAALAVQLILDALADLGVLHLPGH